MMYNFWSGLVGWLPSIGGAIFTTWVLLGIHSTRQESLTTQKSTLETLLSRTPPFASNSFGQYIKPACEHLNTVDVESLYCQKVAELCLDCKKTIYWLSWITRGE